jgi:hypothetical protein
VVLEGFLPTRLSENFLTKAGNLHSRPDGVGPEAAMNLPPGDIIDSVYIGVSQRTALPCAP